MECELVFSCIRKLPILQLTVYLEKHVKYGSQLNLNIFSHSSASPLPNVEESVSYSSAIVSKGSHKIIVLIVGRTEYIVFTSLFSS